jgi:hypothetical protein
MVDAWRDNTKFMEAVSLNIIIALIIRLIQVLQQVHAQLHAQAAQMLEATILFILGSLLARYVLLGRFGAHFYL